MKRDALKTLREQSGQEIAQKVRESRARLYELRHQIRLGQLKNYAQARALRRDIARMLTLAREKGLPSGGKQ